MHLFKKLITFTLVINLISITTFAKPKAYMDVKKDSWSAHPHLVVDDKVIHFGVFYTEGLSEAMSSNPMAFKHAKEFESDQAYASGFLWGGLALALSYSFSTDIDSFNPTIYWGIFLTGLITGSIFATSAQRNLFKSINHYNGVYSTPAKSTWKLEPATNGLGIALTF